MEIVDNAIMLVIPGAMDAGLSSARWLVARGQGHAVVHHYHWAERRGQMADQSSNIDGGVQLLHADIAGMHCGNCVIAVERRLKQIPGALDVRVTYPPGRAVIAHSGELTLVRVQEALGSNQYTATQGDAPPPNSVRHHLEIAAAFASLLGLALALQHFHLLPRGFSVTEQTSYGLVFLIGLVASVSSCLAVTGGLLVALAAKYNEANPHLTDRQRLVPPLYFNLGRIISYALLGGAIGALGAALTLSPAVSGALTLLASLLMIMLGLNMLGLLPSVGRYLPSSLPPALSRRLHDAAAKETKGAAFLLGAATFFLPCGFTQALQLYVLSQASFTVGALTMLVFAIGTLPALLSLAALSSLAKGAFQKHFLRFAGAAVILLGVFNIQSGLVLTGSETSQAANAGPMSVAAEMLPDGVQRISMKVVDLEYVPNQFTVKQGVPVQWWIDGSQAEGCGRVLLAPQLGIRKLLSDSSTTLITFTPNAPGDYAFNCGMGMMTPGSKITVLANTKG